MPITAILVPYKMVVSVWKSSTFQYSIRSYTHRGNGSTPVCSSEVMGDEKYVLVPFVISDCILVIVAHLWFRRR